MNKFRVTFTNQNDLYHVQRETISADGIETVRSIYADSGATIIEIFPHLNPAILSDLNNLPSHAAIQDEVEASAIAARLTLADLAGIDALNYRRLAAIDPTRPFCVASGVLNGKETILLTGGEYAEAMEAIKEERYLSDRGDALRETKYGKGL